jgi:hypothetical protein
MANEESLDSTLNSHLQVIRFIWEREDEQDRIEFGPGFNLISDRTQIERTIFLRLIRYGMGGSYKRIDANTMRMSKKVRVEFIANGRRVISTRGFEHPDGMFSVAVEGHPKPHSLSPREMGEFLLDLLNIPKVHYQRGDKKLLLGFNDLARTFVEDRDFSYSRILAEMYPEERKETVKMMLGLTTQGIADTEEEIRDGEIRARGLAEQIKGLERMLSEFEVGSSVEIDEKRRELESRLAQLKSDEDKLRRKIYKTASEGLRGKDYGANEYRKLREELVAKRERVGEIERELSALIRQIQEKTDLKELLESEVQKLDRHAASQYVLSTFTFSRCPRCLQPIESYMRAREQENRCMLCDRPLGAAPAIDVGAWEKALTDARKAVDEAEELLSFYFARKQKLEHEQTGLHERVESLQSQLAEQTAKYVSPLVEDLSLISQERSQLLTALSELAQEDKQRDYVDRIRDHELPALKAKLDQLQETLYKLQTERGRPGARIEAFLSHFRSFMRATATAHFQDASWDESELLPRINGEDHTKALAAYDLVICVLAFHYSLLAMKVEAPDFDTPHPGLLIIDEPEQQKMRHEQFQNVMRRLVSLAQDHSDAVQMIVAATTNAGLENYLRPIVVYK